jgi:hypothetical protein
MDAYGENPINDTDGIELLHFDGPSTLHELHEMISHAYSDSSIEMHLSLASLVNAAIGNGMLEAQTLAGLLCGSFKKLKYHHRVIDVSKQIAQVIGVLIVVNQFLIIAGSSIKEALLVNYTKLNSRYPSGFKAGGGDRTGKGA